MKVTSVTEHYIPHGGSVTGESFNIFCAFLLSSLLSFVLLSVTIKPYKTVSHIHVQ